MARTYRNINPTLTFWTPDDAERDHKSRQRIIRLNKHIKNGQVGTELGSPYSAAPKGYDSWHEVCGAKGKRWAKHETSAINRRVADRNIRAELNDL